MIRKDIRRALLLWPATASAAVIAATGIAAFMSRPLDIDASPWKVRSDRYVLSQSMESDSRYALVAESAQGAGVAERVGRGSRGLRRPGRLTEHWNVRAPQPMDGTIVPLLAAPVIDPVMELAGRMEVSKLGGHVSMEALVASGPRPSLLSPGVSETVTASASKLSASNLGIFEFARPVFAAAGDVTRGGLLALGKNELVRRYIPDGNPVIAPEDRSSGLIPESVRVLARPNDWGRPTAAWPIPKQLRLELATLSSRGERFASIQSADSAPAITASRSQVVHREAAAVVMGRWAEQVDAKLAEMHGLSQLSDARGGELIRELAVLAQAGLQLAEKVPVRDQQVRWLQTAHSLSRRVSVWAAVWDLTRSAAKKSNSQTLSSFDAIAASPIPSLVADVRAELNVTGDQAGWATFLMLDEIEEAATAGNYDGRAVLGQRFLSRLNYHGLDGAHVRWLDRNSVHRLADEVRTWTITPVDYTSLLEDIERQESDAIDLASLNVTAAFQTLRHSDEVSLARVAKAIDVGYRNANVRTAVSVELLDRLMPAVADRSAPISTTILGASVRGQSHTSSAIGLQLVPDASAWRLNVRADGDVSSQTVGSQSGVRLHSSGQSHFAASTPIKIDASGFAIGQTHVDVNGGNQLRGIDTSMDGWPLLGSLVRSIAASRFEESRGAAQRIADGRVASEVRSGLSSELKAKSLTAQQRLDDLVVGPLAKLDLNPRIIDLETTSERLIARYRVAGDWQLAAHTPRPRAMSDAWMSVQIHQSAINNTLETILPRGETQTFGDLFRDTADLFGQSDIAMPADLPADVEIQFAETRPVTIEIEDDRLWLTFRIVSLSQPGSARLTKFIVRAGYRPEIEGLDAHLVREGHLRISGPGMSMRQRLPVRAIFTKVLDEARPIPITLPRMQTHPAMTGLKVTQFELRDGWLALAIGPESASETDRPDYIVAEASAR